jgi:UV DNA damage endonuclease
MNESLVKASKTWKEKDGRLMVDYSSQQIGERKGKHTSTINMNLFTKYIKDTKGTVFDIMLEIKDK